MESVAVGAFEDDDVGGVGGFGGGQQGGMGGAEVAGEEDAGGGAALAQVAFDVGGAEDVAGGFESEAQAGVAGGERVPLAVGEGDGELADAVEHAGDERGVARDADLEGIFDDEWEQVGGGLTTIDGRLEAGGEQVGQAADMIDMYMCDDEG